MNAAARLLNQGVLSRGWVIAVFLSRINVMLYVTVLGVLISALSMVYVTNTTRSYNALIQQTAVERDRLHMQWGQLLLEKSSLIMQARVEKMAESQLNMVVPDNKSVMVINE